MLDRIYNDENSETLKAKCKFDDFNDLRSMIFKCYQATYVETHIRNM